MTILKDVEINLKQLKRAKNEFDIEHWFDSLFDQIKYDNLSLVF